MRLSLSLILLMIAISASAQDFHQEGMASYYANKFEGRLTANGEIFSNTKLTAAHRTLPFGTKVLVTNISNNKTVVVRINDRGPFIKGRIIDLSQIAAKELGCYREGITNVSIEQLKSPLIFKKRLKPLNSQVLIPFKNDSISPGIIRY